MKTMAFPEDSSFTRVIGRLIGLAIIAGSIWLTAHISREHYRQPRTNDANVRANIVGIAPNVSGQIIELKVVDNQEVNEGDVLFVIDPRPFEIELERAKANLLLTQTQISATSNAVAAAQMNVQRLEAESAYAADHAQRLEPLLEKKFVTQDDLQSARVTAQSADASLAQARAELSRQKSLLGQVDDVNAFLKVAEAAVHSAELNLNYCRVRAPFKGRVTNLNISKGRIYKGRHAGFCAGGHAPLVCDRQFSRNLSRFHPSRHGCGSVSDELSEPEISWQSSRTRLGHPIAGHSTVRRFAERGTDP